MERSETRGSSPISKLGQLLLIACLALMLSLINWWQTRRELQAVTEANEVLRKTLGQMTVGMADKDRQIDQLINSPCGLPETAPNTASPVPPRPPMQ